MCSRWSNERLPARAGSHKRTRWDHYAGSHKSAHPVPRGDHYCVCQKANVSSQTSPGDSGVSQPGIALEFPCVVFSFSVALACSFLSAAYGWPLNVFGAQDAFGLNPSSLQIRRLSSKSGFPACHQGIIVGTVRFVMVVVVGLATLIDKIGFPSPGPSFGAAVCHGHRSSSHSNPWLPVKFSPPLLSPALARAHGA